MADEEKPWYAPGHTDSLQPSGCTPRPRERLWTLTKGAKRVDAELLCHGEHGVEVQFAHEAVMAHARTFVVRELAVREADEQRARLTGEAGRLRSRAIQPEATSPQLSPRSDSSDWNRSTREPPLAVAHLDRGPRAEERR
jgi:hypothetical protein